jgi:hypothetical protein
MHKTADKDEALPVVVWVIYSEMAGQILPPLAACSSVREAQDWVYQATGADRESAAWHEELFDMTAGEARVRHLSEVGPLVGERWSLKVGDCRYLIQPLVASRPLRAGMPHGGRTSTATAAPDSGADVTRSPSSKARATA